MKKFLVAVLIMVVFSASAEAENFFAQIKIEPEKLDIGYYSEEIDYTEVSTPRSFKIGNYIVSRSTVGRIYKNATPNIFLYQTLDGEIVAAVVSQKQYTTYSMRMMYEETKIDVFNAFKKEFKGKYKEAEKELIAEGGFHNGEMAVVFSTAHFDSVNDLPFKTCDDYFSKLPDDILSEQETAEELMMKAQNCDFAAIIKKCNGYLKTNGKVADEDQVHEIIGLAEEGKKLSKNCKIKYDKFDESVEIYYSDIKDVNKNISICTYYDGTFVSKIGFRTSNWIFFNTVDIVADGMEKIHLYFGNTTYRDSTGSGIKEYAIYNFRKEQVEQMHNAKNHEIRFSSEKGDKTIEKKISKKEIEALYTINRIVEIRTELINMIYPFT